MLRWMSNYITRNEPRLISSVDASWRETPLRVFLICLIFTVLGQFTPLWVTVTAALLCFVDDVALYFIRQALKHDHTLRPFWLLAAFNLIGSVGFAGFLGYIRVYSDETAGRVGATMVLVAVIVELASPKARSHPFAWITIVPIWAALFGTLAFALVEVESSALVLASGLIVLAATSLYTVHIFVENARNIRELEHETERANAASAQKSRFLTTMSHEIRTPLHALYGTAQLLQTARDPKDVQRLAQILLAASSDLKVIVDDVIDYDRAEAGRTEIKLEPTDPSALIKRMADLFRANATAKGLTLNVFCAKSVEGHGSMLDPVRLGQILSNLLSNAVKFTNRGGITLRLDLDLAGQMLRFKVADTGDGIPDSAKDRIFKAHEKLDRGNRSPESGAGLGLAISQLLAHRMGGTLTVADAAGGGSEFTLSVPFIASRLPDKASPAPAIPQPPLPRPMTMPPAAITQTGGALSGRHILVVDDVSINREVLRAMLERYGARVSEAANGRMALDIIASQGHFDAVLLDNSMPVMSGHDMLIHLRARPGPEANLIVIGISAGTIREECDAFIALGLDGFLSKPVAISDLIELIVTLCRTPSRHRPMSLPPTSLRPSV